MSFWTVAISSRTCIATRARNTIAPICTSAMIVVATAITE